MRIGFRLLYSFSGLLIRRLLHNHLKRLKSNANIKATLQRLSLANL